MMRMAFLVFATVGVHCSTVFGWGDAPWARFRGPNGSGESQSALFPVEWHADHILWKVKPLGLGVSSASVWNDHFVITSSNEDGTRRWVECRRLADGELAWSYETPFDTNSKHAKNQYAAATPLCDSDGVYALFSSATRSAALAIDWNGALRWKEDLGPFESRHGAGASPILMGELLVVPLEQDGPSTIVALNRQTGELAWRTPRSATLAAYSTPIIVSSPSGEQLLATSTAGMTALEPRTGTLLWTESCFADRCVGSPIVAGDLAIASCGGGGRGTRLVAVRTEAELPEGSSRIAWEETKTIPYCPTPIVVGGLLFFVTDQGIARCMNAATGEEIWTERLLSNTTSSPVCVRDKIFALAEDGNGVVFSAKPELTILARNQVDDEFYSTPAISGDRMILRGSQYLWCIGPAKD